MIDEIRVSSILESRKNVGIIDFLCVHIMIPFNENPLPFMETIFEKQGMFE
jgi:hypothetical protein